MMASVERIFVIVLASGTHFPGGDRRVGAIVGQAFDDRITGSAIGAIDIGILVSSVGRVSHFPQTLVAERQIWRDTNRRD
jgi:hypothetical protein